MDNRPTKALVLAAGSSTRLRPLTNVLPKALLPVGGKPVLDHQIEALAAAGIRELALVVGFEKQKIIEHLKERRYPLSLRYVDNDAYASTQPILGGLLPALKYLEGPLLFFHCDALFDESAISALMQSASDSAMLVREGHWDEEAGKVVVEHGFVRKLGKHIGRERATGEYLQVAKLGAGFCRRLKSVVEERALHKNDGYTIDAFNEVVTAGELVAAVPFSGKALEIDTLEDYAAAEAAWAQ